MVNLDKKLFNAFFTSTAADFQYTLCDYIMENGCLSFTFWTCEGNICEPALGEKGGSGISMDIFDLGYSGDAVTVPMMEIQYFDEAFSVHTALFFKSSNRVLGVVTFHEEPPAEIVSEISECAPFIGSRMDELLARDANINVYVDYQKKIEFIKKGSQIFKAIELDKVIAVSLSFFMEVFTAEAVCALYKSEFSGYGLEENDLREKISIEGVSAWEFASKTDRTEFIEESCHSNDFNINNVFIVYEETMQIRFLLFNIHFDIVPDKEFSELVSSLVTIAVENAANHEAMTRFKLEENEMKATGSILNKFVQRDVYYDSYPEIYGISYPARTAGGDFFFVREQGDTVFFCVADVCGKGYSAAVFTVVLSVFVAMSNCFEGENGLENLTRTMNLFLIDKNFEDRFITAFFGTYNRTNKELKYISCGHEPGVLYDEKGMNVLGSHYLPLGIADDNYESESVPIPENSTLFVYTDGITEYISQDDLEDKVGALVKGDCENVVHELYKELVTDRDTQRDDFTCMLLNF
ncbi:PP2C family protein-serine/threonine phosphatase [Limisalsivibrio acetivorans]|uniref:PP2C family protein-serine/threonine phosphatase n=1 Tax=Limisalsivibrio acetivorans TaxID=1304888 RepID=UPI0003B34B0F|nr:PP2C family protein-serine/threonine phosphatase [Limisalsivibrio acetivorans]